MTIGKLIRIRDEGSATVACPWDKLSGGCSRLAATHSASLTR